MSTIVIPTVGRKMHFRPNGVEGFTQMDDQPLDATVVWVARGGKFVNVSVLDHAANAHGQIAVHVRQDKDPAPAAGVPYVEWMPFQVGQAITADRIGVKSEPPKK